MRRFALLIGAVVVLSGLAWWFVADSQPEPVSKPTPPSQVDKIIAFCAKPANESNPLCTVEPGDSDAVRDAVMDAIERQTTGPQIIERVTERDDDDDSDSPDVRVIVPSTAPTSRPATPAPAPSRTTQPPILPDIDIPAVPQVPLPELPLLN